MCIHTYMHTYIYDPGSAVPPPPLPPQWFPPPCGVVGCFPPPCGVVWSGGGSAWGGFPPPRLWHGVGSGFLAVVPPAFLGLLWVFGILIPTMIMMMMMGTMITNIIIINSSTLIMFLWFVVRCLLPGAW